MYDTLMQMGRWFGYRDGYIDVCRLYTPTELIEWFGHIAEAAEELRQELDIMVATGATPEGFWVARKITFNFDGNFTGENAKRASYATDLFR